MATSIASQLQAIRSVIQKESEPRKRPITRPSVLYDPKEAADIDVDTIFSIALSGLEVLVSVDDKFRNYKNDLFSYKTKDLDRELLTEAENTRINSSIASYLRLLSGRLQLPASLKTLEYLIRRYKVHAYNTEDLVLCALPYHDTHVFVRIVQLLDLRNNRWKFLEGVKTSGAPPPRHVLVQQCIRDMGVLDALCNYASPAKKYQPSRPVVNLCTAVVVEVLGSLAAVDSDVVRRILPFVVSGLQPVARGGSDHKAGALMIVALLANKVALSPKLLKSLTRSIAEVACEDAKDTTNLLQFRLSIMALVNIVQLQPVDLLPKKALEIMRETSDIVGMLLELSKEYNIDKFLIVLVESLIEYSSSDDAWHLLLISILETIPVKGFVDHVVSKVLSSCKKMSQRDNKSTKSGSGSWAKRILMIINKNYPQELRRSVLQFLEDNKVQSIKDDATFDIFCSMLDGSQDSTAGISHSKIWFALHHPRAEVRCAALRSLNASGIVKTNDGNSQMLETIQDAVLSQLSDNDLTVVQAALSVNGLAGLLSPSDLVKAFGVVSRRCFSTLTSSSADKTALVYDVAVSFLRIVLSVLDNNADFIKKVAAIIFPFLIVLPKTQILSLKVLELVREINWPFFQNLIVIPVQETKLQQEVISAINLEIVNSLAETFLKCPDEYMPWLIESSHDSGISKSLFFMVMMQSFIMANEKSEQFAALFDACFSVLRTECEVFEFADYQEFKKETLHWNCAELIDQLLDADVMRLNRTALICIFWRLLKGLVSISVAPEYDNNWISNRIGELFMFFSSSNKNHVFEEHLHHLVKNCPIPPVDFLSTWFTKEDVPAVIQVESLNCLAYICAEAEDSLLFQLLANFPLLFVPLGSDIQDVKIAAMNCIELLCALACRVDYLSKRNGNNANWYGTLGDLLGIIVQQKRLILSDKTFLPSLFMSLLGSSHDSLRVPTNVERRFDESTKEKFLTFILSSALQHSAFVQLTVISLLKDLGNMIMLVKDVQLLLSQLLKRCSQCCLEAEEGYPRLSKTEIKILCLLLEMCATSAPLEGHTNDDFLFRALQLDGLSSDDHAVIKPCVIALQKLNCQFYSGLTTDKQELLFRELMCLFRSNNGDIQNATRDALLRLKITCSMVVRTVEFIFKQETRAVGSLDGRNKKKSVKRQISNLNSDPVCKREATLCLLSSLLEILMLKKDISNREQLIGPLFELLERILSDEFVPSQDKKWIQCSLGISQTMCAMIFYIKQTLLSILEDIIGSIIEGNQLEGEAAKKINIRLLVGCARSENDVVTRNHVFSLLSVIAKVFPNKILKHLVDIITVVGESTITQTDSYSQHVFEDLISAVVPCLLAKTDNLEKLLQVFVNVLPEVAEHRRQSIIVSLLRNLGEQNSVAPLLVILFRSLVSRKGLLCLNDAITLDECFVQREWEYAFASLICAQYSCTIWLPAVGSLLQLIGSRTSCNEMPMEFLCALELISQKLRDPELIFKLESTEDSQWIQGTLQELMEHVVSLSPLIDSKGKEMRIPVNVQRKLKECLHAVLRNITMVLSPSSYFSGIANLLGHLDQEVQKKALGLLSETIRDHASRRVKHEGRVDTDIRSSNSWLHMEDCSRESFQKMCSEIVHIVDDDKDEIDTSLKLSAIGTIESLAQSFYSTHAVYSLCLTSIAKGINSPSLAITSSCLRAAGALVNVLGPKALAELPLIMENVVITSRDISSQSDVDDRDISASSSTSKESLMLSILVILEAVIDKLGGFLSPYLGNIIELVVLRSDYTSELKLKLKVRADRVRGLLAEKIPARLALPPLLKIYTNAVASGDSSVTITFDMLSSLLVKMDRPSIVGYHGKVFEFCLCALDLRRQQPGSIQNIDDVEKSVINAMISLTMKLTETMFKPLFIRAFEWAKSNVDNDGNGGSSLDRSISFYGLVNSLAENHRSLFVPYFKYLLESCVQHLSDVRDGQGSGLPRKKKKAKVQEGVSDKKGGKDLLLNWHLRALVTSSLHKCFLYDTGDVKFLDTSNFQALLKPIVLQLAIEPPALLEEHSNILSTKEVDDLLVVCIGQMAVTAGSDLLWKPLNHEVLLQTRSDKVRSRILGLRVVKYLLDHLREEYLVFLPETIPFLGELLEDVELPVKSLAQDILKEMESLSGESLRQYLL